MTYNFHPTSLREYDIRGVIGETLDDQSGAWTVRLFHKPFINWLWFGALLMVVGGFMAVAVDPRRSGTDCARARGRVDRGKSR